MLVVALVQGAALYALHLALDEKVWPATDFRWLFPLYALATIIPLVIHLDLAHLREPLFLKGLAAFAALLAAVGAYAGSTLTPGIGAREGILLPFIGTMAALWWIVTPFLQTSVRSGHPRAEPPYAELFEAGWQNTLVVVQAGLFTGLFWALLFLWAELFDIVGVGIFEQLFQEPAFVYPVTSVTFGHAVALAQSRESFVLLLRRHLFGVLAWLLPVVALIASAFLVTLPFTGLEPLWKTRHATFLMLWLQVFLLFFVNAAFQDGSQEPPYPAWLRAAVRAAVVTVPVYASLCAYSLWLRIQQHGLSVDRIWAALFVLVAGLYGLGYAYAAFREGPWMGRVGWVNTVMAWVLVLLIVGVNSPLLEPKRIAAADQLSRLLDGKVPAARFDYDYLRFNLGVFGTRALRRLAQGVPGHAESAEIQRLAAVSLAKERRWDQSPPPPDLARVIEVLPSGAELDPDLVSFWRAEADKPAGAGLVCLRVPNVPCVVLRVDLDGDGADEVASVSGMPLNVYARTDSGWRRVGELRADAYPNNLWLDSVRVSTPRLIPTRWRTLELGGRQFQLWESTGPR
jgi:hypothetical protein